MSQEELAAKLQITRSKLAAHEKKNTTNPPVEDLIKVSEFFKISIDSLLKVELSKLSELKLRDLEAGNDVYLAGKNIRVLAITVDKANNENVEHVPVKSHAGYLTGYSDPDFIGRLPKYSIPGVPKNGTHRIFTIDGDSMLPLKPGTDIVGEYIENPTTLKPDTPCHVIIHGESAPVFKLFTFQQNGKVLLRSLNKLFAPYEVDAADIIEVWKFHSYISRQFPEPELDMTQLTNIVLELKSEVKKITKSK